MLEAAQYVQAIEQRQGQKIACFEEISYKNGWIDRQAVQQAATRLAKSGYGDYLLRVLQE